MGVFVRRSENSTVEIIFPQGCDFRQDTKNEKTGMSISISFPIENLHVLAKKNVNQQIAVAILPQSTPKKYTWPGSNWRPSACWADVIATRPQVQVNTTIVIQTFQILLAALAGSDRKKNIHLARIELATFSV